MSRNSAIQSPYPRSREHSEGEKARKSYSKESLPEFSHQKSAVSKGSSYQRTTRDEPEEPKKSASKEGYNLLNLSRKENIAE